MRQGIPPREGFFFFFFCDRIAVRVYLCVFFSCFQAVGVGFVFPTPLSLGWLCWVVSSSRVGGLRALSLLGARALVGLRGCAGRGLFLLHFVLSPLAACFVLHKKAKPRQVAPAEQAARSSHLLSRPSSCSCTVVYVQLVVVWCSCACVHVCGLRPSLRTWGTNSAAFSQASAH